MTDSSGEERRLSNGVLRKAAVVQISTSASGWPAVSALVHARHRSREPYAPYPAFSSRSTMGKVE